MSETGDLNRKQMRAARRRFLSTRSRIRDFFVRARDLHVPYAYRGLRWLSALALLLFLVQVLTGVLLSLYYYPEPGVAYQSVRFLTEQVTAGWLLRSVHGWSGDLLLATVVLHVVVVFFRRAFLYPREYQWFIGVLLLPAFLAARYTGRLLPWDTLGFEATRRGLDLLEAVPVIGGFTATWLRGGQDMGANTLARFYSTHVLILPWMITLMAALHLYLVKRHGMRGTDS